MDFQTELQKLIDEETSPPLDPIIEIAKAQATVLGEIKKREENISLQVEEIYDIVKESDENAQKVKSMENKYLIDDVVEPEVEKEIKYYNSLPIEFNDFIDLPELSDGEIQLVCTAKTPADPVKNWLPSYDFLICKGSEKVGNINLRIGYGGGPFNSNCYYGGQIGYGVDEEYRGKGFAGRACKLLEPVAKAHGMTKLLVATNAKKHCFHQSL
jgi:predicted acetyltransferase